MPRPTDQPDIEIGARVKAKKLRFKEVPETEFRASDGSRPVQERKNLPEKVEPNVTYRDVEITWHAQANVRTTTGGRIHEAQGQAGQASQEARPHREEERPD